MIRIALVIAAAAAGTAYAESLPKGFELSLRTSTQNSNEPLTTDRIAELDPAQPNPHLRRWVVNRNIEISGWKSRKLPGDLVGVLGGGVSGTSTVYLRPAGPWYDSPAQFPCDEHHQPDPVFATEEGSRESAAAAAQLWDEMLSSGKFKLSLLLAKVAAVNEKSAWTKADRVFQEWLVRLDREWRARVASEILPRQWKNERKRAEEAGYCLHGRNAKPSQKMTSPEVWMTQESPTPQPSPTLTPAARAPSRRWNGDFAVRMDVGVSENSILGQMLIDPATPRSVLSPDWMRAQGMPPEWLLVPEAQPERVRVAAGPGLSGLGEVLRVERAFISNFPVSVSRFLLFQTDLFDEPEFAAPCCSGVLGMDLLRRYVVEFEGGKPTAVQLWPIKTYRPIAGYEWVEVRENAQGELTPICSDRVKALSGAKKLCRDPRHSLREATDTIVYDLPHGRVWYSPKELAAPDYKNVSGLHVEYTYLKGDRVLVVKSIGRGSVAQQLEKAGLKKGMVITEIDGIPTVDLDLWEVNRRLAGVYGDVVSLKWKTAKGFVAEPLRVIQRSIREESLKFQ